MTSRRNFIKRTALGTIASVAGTALSVTHAKAMVTTDQLQPLRKDPVILLKSSWNDQNIGDVGHTPGTLRLIEKYIPKAQVLLWHSDPRPATEAIVLTNFPKVKIVRGQFFGKDKEAPGDMKEAFDQADIYIHNSGMSMNYGLFNTDWTGTITNLAPFIYCHEKGIPFGLYGQSFDKFAPPSSTYYRDVLNRAAFIFTRDKESLKFLSDSNFKPELLEFGPDGCFGIDVRDEEKGLAYLSEHGLEEKKFLVVVIRTHTPKPDSAGDNLNPAKPTEEQMRQDALRIGKVNSLITTWVKKTGMKVLLAPEAFKEIRGAKEMVYDALPAEIKSNVVWRDTFWNADEAMSVYARAHSLFGMEPHSLIMGLALGLPVVHARPLAHGRKGWMFRDIGVSEWLFEMDQDSEADITAAIMNIAANYPLALKKAALAMQVVKERQEYSMKVIEKLLTKR